jgi:hypothetical protein
MSVEQSANLEPQPQRGGMSVLFVKKERLLRQGSILP